MTAAEMIETARAHETKGPMASSAELCRERAEACVARGLTRCAGEQALRSLEFSLGVFNPVVAEVRAAVKVLS